MTKIICDMCGKEIKSQDLKTIYLSSPVAKEVCSNCCSKLEKFFTEECYKNFEKEHEPIVRNANECDDYEYCHHCGRKIKVVE